MKKEFKIAICLLDEKDEVVNQKIINCDWTLDTANNFKAHLQNDKILTELALILFEQIKIDLTPEFVEELITPVIKENRENPFRIAICFLDDNDEIVSMKPGSATWKLQTLVEFEEIQDKESYLSTTAEILVGQLKIDLNREFVEELVKPFLEDAS